MYLGSVGKCPSSPQTMAVFKVNVTNIVTGILSIVSDVNRFYTAYISLSLSLNLLLTLIIVVRLVLRSRSIRAATGSSAGISGLYKTIATILIESSALFTVSSLLLVGTWAADNAFANVFVYVLVETQVRASLQL